MKKYLCSLGSNIEPQHHFSQARAALEVLSGDITFSRNIPTSPVDINTDNAFLNALFIIETPMTAGELKREFNRIEEALGRDRSDPERSLKDRTIDIDILGSVEESPKVPDYLTSLLPDLGLAS
ncbi:2-amino-4-hydroxy-6-hydroxymethyldihydropteridine diphosphokinase [Idiomarina sp. HP20-50]|uniref:2-amino-4-hydroxy-6- hydroxymethyldihydropteridine diphosphokinase n=1 Tax=Idiomarina sp. HP20-50 TaxID=3070813 RepID=UPI00294B039B|nr:2-amino-4-hydroxy-6-hydroxymethyldihydropteridine diphosphokinase [Idiomarina sp. HP20-50]MDV6314871.1 2-amino-4-hydroxy-6-hydroxymethyldihydropteridine diphosphokinase [Idiomarina sp. HP20-50]